MRFGRFCIDRERLVLEHDGEELALAPKSVELLGVLAERPGVIVTKRELLDRLWPDTAVEEANLSQHIYVIRKALGARDQLARRAIVTVPKRGYRFVPPRAVQDDGLAAVAEVGPAFGVTPFDGGSGLREAAADAAAPRRFPTSGNPNVRWLIATAAVLALSLLLGARASAPEFRRSVGPRLPAEAAVAARLGRYYLDLRTRSGIERSRTYFARVIAASPANALGYAGLADALTMTGDYRFGRSAPRVYFQRALSLARHAVSLDVRSAPAHTALGNVAMHLHEAAVARAQFERAITLDPAYAPAHHWLGTELFDEGDIAGSVRELTLASQLNPVSTATDVWLVQAAYFNRQYDVAIEHGRRVTELDPSRFDSLREVGLAYEARGDFHSALTTFARIPATSHDAPDVPLLQAAVYARLGHRDVARRLMAQRKGRAEWDSELPFALLALGERRDAARSATRLHFMDCGERVRFSDDPRFDGVRADAAFEPVLQTRCRGRA